MCDFRKKCTEQNLKYLLKKDKYPSLFTVYCNATGFPQEVC